MSNAVTSRLAQVALKAVLAEVESAPELAAEALARLLGVGSAPVPRSPEGEALDVGRQVLAAAAAGGNDPDDDEDERAAPRRKAKARKRKTIQNGNPKKNADTAESVALVERLIEHHGGVNPAAAALGRSHALVRRWRRGAPLQASSLEALRQAVAELDAGGKDDQGEQGEGETEAAGLLRQLVEREGDLAAVGERLGLNLDALRRIESRGPCGPSTMGRLRTALANPPAQERASEATFRRAAVGG